MRRISGLVGNLESSKVKKLYCTFRVYGMII